MHYYLVKLAAVWGLVLGLFLLLKISLSLPIPRPVTWPLWVLEFLDLLATYGMTLILATILAAIWQLAARR
jgi:hypothetical protein